MEITGKIEKFLEVQSGESKNGGTWKKQSFVVKTEEQYNNLYCFEIFGEDKVENLTKYQKVGDSVKVSFNVQTNEWKDKYFTSLGAWRIEKSDGVTTEQVAEPVGEEDDSLPF